MYNDNNIFAKIISGEIPTEKLYEDDKTIVIKDINPAATIHLLVIPKNKYIDFDDFTSNASEEEIAHYFKIVSYIAKKYKAYEYRIISNKGALAGQTIFHFHTHILSGIINKELN